MILESQTIGKSCEVGDGTHSKIEREDSGVLYLTCRNFKDGRVDYSKVYYISEKNFTKYFKNGKKALICPQPGDLVFSIIGTIGEPYLVRDTDRFGISSSVAIVRSKPENVDPMFLYYWMRGPKFQSALFATKGGVAQGYVSLEMIKSLPAPTLPLPTQRKIAGILSAYDDLIENNLRRIKILEEMAQSLYREWFVHLRFPGHDSVQFIDSELGQIPNGWEVGKLEDVLVLQRGFDLPKAERAAGDIPIYAASGITGYHSESKVKGPGIVTGRSGTIGQVVYIHEDFWPLNTALWVKAFPRSEPLYAYFVLSSIDLKGFNSGAAVPTLNRNDIHSLQTLIPPIALQSRFQECAGAMLAQARILTLSIQNLRRTRDLLLPQLLTP